jgi:hypothetical protein
VKIISYGLALAAMLTVWVAQFSLTSSIHASGLSRAKRVSVATASMSVNCQQHPSATVMKNWSKYHICGYGESGSDTSSNSVSGNCGTVSNAISNEGGGVAQLVVTISPSAISGGMYSAFYSGVWQNSGSGGSGTVGNVRTWAPLPSFSWPDAENYYTDTGNVTFTVNVEKAMTTFLGECTLVAPISASATITI